MSEKAPGKYPLTSAELAVLNAIDQEKIEKATIKLNDLAQSMGYVSVSTLEELSLTPDQIGKIPYHSLIENRSSARYYMADRKDGKKAKLVAIPRTDGCYFAEFFSPGNQGGNHDFSLSEMKGNMQLHLEIKPTKGK